MNSIRIIKEPSNEKQFLIIDKPANLPTAPLSSNDSENALAQTISIYPEIKTVIGKKQIEYGLLHRIDTLTSGLVLIATSQKAYDELIELQKQNKIIKTYQTKCKLDNINAKNLTGFPDLSESFLANLLNGKQTTLKSYFRAFGDGKREVRPVTENSGKSALKKLGKTVEYTTILQLKNVTNDTYTVECNITNGYRHQVRCHLAWLGLPIINDPLYNFEQKNNAENSLEFSAIKLNINGDLYQITQKET